MSDVSYVWLAQQEIFCQGRRTRDNFPITNVCVGRCMILSICPSVCLFVVSEAGKIVAARVPSTTVGYVFTGVRLLTGGGGYPLLSGT